MRRAWLVVLVAMALVAMAAPAAARVVYNERHSEVIAEGGWWQGEWGDETISSGMIGARLAKGAAEAEIWFDESVGTAVMCDAGTPDDSADDYLGYEWTYRSGWGVGSLDVTKSFGSATASGIVNAWTGGYSECDWYGDGEMVTPQNGDPGNGGELVAVSLMLTADGPRTIQTGSYSFHIPGEYNEHSRNRSVYRSASGVMTVEGVESATQWGQIGEYSWSSHVNSK